MEIVTFLTNREHFKNLSREEVWWEGLLDEEKKGEAVLYLLNDCKGIIAKIMGMYGVSPTTIGAADYEDYLEDIKVRLFENYDCFDPEKSSFVTWFYNLVRGVVTNNIEESKRRSYMCTSEMARYITSLDKEFGGCDFRTWRDKLRAKTNLSTSQQNRILYIRWNGTVASLQEQNADGDFCYENLAQHAYPTPEEAVLGKCSSDAVMLYDAMQHAELSERERTAFLLHIGEQKTFAEIAAMCGVTPAAIQQAEARAVARIKNYLASNGVKTA